MVQWEISDISNIIENLIFSTGPYIAVGSRKQKMSFYSENFILFGQFAQKAFQRRVPRPRTTKPRNSRFILDFLNFSYFRPN